MSHVHTPNSVVDDDKHFRINPDNRAIERTAENDPVLVQFDHNSERITFDIPIKVDGHDLSQCSSIQIHYINIDASNTSNTKSSIYDVDDFAPSATDPETLSFSWLVDQAGTTLVGPLYFAISFKCTSVYTDEDGSEKIKLDYLWSTSPYKGVAVSDGINNNEKLGVEYYDAVDEWFATIANAGEMATEDAVSQINAAAGQAVNKTKVDIDAYAQQVIQNDLIPDALRISDILVQEKGNSPERIMSQNATTVALQELENEVDEKNAENLATINERITEMTEKVASLTNWEEIPIDADVGYWNIYTGLNSGCEFYITTLGNTYEVTAELEVGYSYYDNNGTLHSGTYTYPINFASKVGQSSEYKFAPSTRVDIDPVGGAAYLYISYLLNGMTTQFLYKVIEGTAYKDEVSFHIQSLQIHTNGTVCKTISNELPNFSVSVNGISSISKTATNGLVDTYTIIFDNGQTFNYEVKNGNGITDVIRTKVGDYEDTYTMYLTNGSSTTFKVPNGGPVNKVILTDRTTGKDYELYIDNGKIFIEEA